MLKAKNNQSMLENGHPYKINHFKEHTVRQKKKQQQKNPKNYA